MDGIHIYVRLIPKNLIFLMASQWCTVKHSMMGHNETGLILPTTAKTYVNYYFAINTCSNYMLFCKKKKYNYGRFQKNFADLYEVKSLVCKKKKRSKSMIPW